MFIYYILREIPYCQWNLIIIRKKKILFSHFSSSSPFFSFILRNKSNDLCIQAFSCFLFVFVFGLLLKLFLQVCTFFSGVVFLLLNLIYWIIFVVHQFYFFSLFCFVDCFLFVKRLTEDFCLTFESHVVVIFALEVK